MKEYACFYKSLNISESALKMGLNGENRQSSCANYSKTKKASNLLFFVLESRDCVCSFEVWCGMVGKVKHVIWVSKKGEKCWKMSGQPGQ